MSKTPKPSWTICKRQLLDWPQDRTLNLIEELYKLSTENRQFLHARLLPQSSGMALDDAKRRVERLLSVRAVFGNKFQHRDVKRVFDQFEKATRDVAALAALLVHDLDVGCQTFAEIGDFEPLVDHLYSTMRRLEKCLNEVLAEERVPIVAGLVEVASRWKNRFGWGLSDELFGMAEFWREKVQAGATEGD